MKKSNLLSGAVCTFVMLMVSGAQAALVTFNFTGVVTQIGQVNSYGGTSIGDTFSGSFTFDDSVVGSGGIYNFSGSGVGISATIGSSSFQINPFTIRVSNQIGGNGITDEYMVYGSEGPAQSDTDFQIVLVDASGLVFSDVSLPLTPPPLDAFDRQANQVRLNIPATTNPNSAFNLTSLTAVPVPAAVWLFGSALGLLGWIKKKRPLHKQLGQGLAAALVLVITTMPLSAQAATVNWIANSGQWDIGSNWDSGAQPAPGDIVNLQFNFANRVNVDYYNTLYTAPTDRLSSLTIDSISGTGGAGVTLTQHPTHPLYADNEYIGYAGRGNYAQIGSTNTVTNDLVLGWGTTGNGRYNLYGGTLSAGSEAIGRTGFGVFTQSGGTHTVTNNLTLGNGMNSGTYTLSGGVMDVGGDILNGSGSSTLIIDGGTMDVGGDILNGSGSSALIIDGGTLNVAGGDIDVGTLILGSASGASGSHTLSGTDTITTYDEAIGTHGTGTFTQTGGTNIVTNNLGIGASTGSGTYNLSGGTLRAGRIINNDTLDYTGGSLSADIIINYVNFNLSGTGSLTVNGNVTNTATGTVKAKSARAIWAGTFTNNGAYLSGSADNYFTNLIIGGTGYLVSGASANWFVNGDFTNNSLQNTLWNTGAASLIFKGAGVQNLYFAGIDLGTGGSGYSNNFAWGGLSLGSGIRLNIWDSNNDGNAAFYAGLVSLADGVNMTTLTIDYIFSDYNIYYNPLLAGNGYLGGQTFALNGSGFLMPSAVPVPAAVWLFGSALGLLGWMRYRGGEPEFRV